MYCNIIAIIVIISTSTVLHNCLFFFLVVRIIHLLASLGTIVVSYIQGTVH